MNSQTSASKPLDLEVLKKLLTQSGAPELFHAGILKHVQELVERASQQITSKGI